MNVLLMHYSDVTMGRIASQITSLTSVYSTVYSDSDQSKHQSSASLAFVWGIHRRPVNSPHKWPVTRKMFPLDDVIMVGHEHLIMQLIAVSSHDINVLCTEGLRFKRQICIFISYRSTSLSHGGTATSCGDINVGQHWLRNDLLPHGTKPLHTLMLTYHQMPSLAFTWEQFHKKKSWTLISNMCSERLRYENYYRIS